MWQRNPELCQMIHAEEIKKLALQIVAAGEARYRFLPLPWVRAPFPAFARSQTASIMLSRRAAGRSAAFGSSDGPKGPAAD
jgi:hypothetical protein